MKKYLMMIFALVASVMMAVPLAYGNTGGNVQLMIDTRANVNGESPQGIEAIRLSIYDVSDWYHQQTGSPEEVKKEFTKEFGTKEGGQAFVGAGEYPTINKDLRPDENGKIIVSLPSVSQGKTAVYLILGDGETGSFKFAPILYPLVEAEKEITAKYYTEIPPKPIVPPTKPGDTPSTTGSLKNLPRKNLPITGEELRSYLSTGGVMITLGLLGYIIKNKRRNK